MKDNDKLKDFGDCITLDHIALGDNWGGFHYALTILDRATGFRMAYPVKTRNEHDTTDNIRRFIGTGRIKRAYGDCAPEFIIAMDNLKIPYDRSTAGRPQNHGVKETLTRISYTVRGQSLSKQDYRPASGTWQYDIIAMRTTPHQLRTDNHHVCPNTEQRFRESISPSGQ